MREEIKSTIVEWSHIQDLDYKQVPFKCRHCHGYGYFARNCKKKSEEEFDKEKVDQWTQVQKAGTSKLELRMKGKVGKLRNGIISVEKRISKPQRMGNVSSTSNPFMILRHPEDHPPVLEEGEVQQFDVHQGEGEEKFGIQEQSGPILLETSSTDATTQDI